MHFFVPFFTILFSIIFYAHQSFAALSTYTNAVVDEYTHSTPGFARSACLVSKSPVVKQGPYASGVYVEFESKRFVLSCRHLPNPEYVFFLTNTTTEEETWERFAVQAYYPLDAERPYDSSNDVQVLFLTDDPFETFSIPPRRIANESKTLSRNLRTYGVGTILQKGFTPFVYSQAHAGELALIKFNGQSGHATIWDRLQSKLYRCPAPASTPFIRVTSNFSPAALQHPLTEGFSGSGILDEDGDVVGISHVGSPIAGRWWKAVLAGTAIEGFCYRYCPSLSTFNLIGKGLNRIHPKLGRLGQGLYALYNFALLAETMWRRTTFMYSTKTSKARAVLLPPLTPQIREILTTHSARSAVQIAAIPSGPTGAVAESAEMSNLGAVQQADELKLSAGVLGSGADVAPASPRAPAAEPTKPVHNANRLDRAGAAEPAPAAALITADHSANANGSTREEGEDQ